MGPIHVRFCPDFSQEQECPESNLLLRGSRTPEELLRLSEAALVWLPFPLEHLKFHGKKCSPGNPAPMSIRERKVK
jgi:hypothetical protein